MSNRGCFFNSVLFLAILFLPVIVGQIIETFMVLEDEYSTSGKVLWLVLIWLVPVIGTWLYLFFGQRPPQRRGYIRFGQSA
ncbi:phospholipase D-like protein [Thermosporothrix hazakensis]|uniref:Phospholipase D-like protein n=2 Tax=Thermosporothrix TaxID=768650 RepID=A0A326UEE8_THEHA|nr:PLDc N-terminal domain-containing protein [Thermosporothrix hazakensis]PZW36666.1 phospholipase D-like protein [Thermosporothrix hazakensis]BBH89134.1 hypothetical protein KTC_38850 [Thermosporothrix sp. COM3]GCE47317.1 hypothetical protein KTH_21860 [Thermosporothrix hazakensis]